MGDPAPFTSLGAVMYTIGEFSRITGLSVKTLRFYHEEGILLPSRVDAESGYRYYKPELVEMARVIGALRELEIPLLDIIEIMASHEDEADILGYLRSHLQTIQAKMARHRDIARKLEQIIQKEQEARLAMQNSPFEVQIKELPEQLIAGIRMTGKYSDCGQGFAKLGRALGFRIRGKAMMLIHDTEYKELDADFEPCMPVSGAKPADAAAGIQVRKLPGGKAVCLLHQGPYSELGRSYAVITDYLKANNLRTQTPSREVYLKGPGMIFKGNPKKYLTEIQFMIEA